ncbi:MAG: hypothetical protein A2406_00200 [Candidatus Komeilibacteria bacterium RIFOXYC1_FULL_37_11]|uniref:Uncharacterized protein n=1 Tax=Candidatus Komeilibacteria bacterium RIFOXYC1_FULL_37_11 TaxID=1798555 RepID=A0A1G2BYS7_9BACT|nr:MAG: hypothetical protein A2406_00200 [Candidatus Komeilibacteria bacterium RIFOXYC1_FULL_37_11]OGY95223.1 MAG: hypothetical protein A2611_00765 [Candidatus Komeilibacteria bacterium RIFOXYD1_FULL_37_29]OGY96895.1 MAG: hypothetical protein A2543_00900 [Candidatus Komeilibacteria bacterium RIFOXYD2_FULL_37_8]
MNFLEFLVIVTLIFLFIYIPFLGYVGDKEIGICYPYHELRQVKVAEMEILPPGYGWHWSSMAKCIAYIPLDTFQTTLSTGEAIRYWFEPQGLKEYLEEVNIGQLHFGGSYFKDQLQYYARQGISRSFLGVDTMSVISRF